jgi:hypothetical protein
VVLTVKEALVRVVLGWLAIVAVSLGLGVTLYATSLQGSTTGYQESVISPRPVPTVVKHRTKIVRKPAKTKVVYMTPVPVRTFAPAPAQTSSSDHNSDD